MQDIRTGLRERLSLIERERVKLEERLNDLAKLKERTERMLEMEAENYSQDKLNDLTTFIREALQESESSLTVKDLKTIAQTKEFIILGNRPGQRIQGALLALKKKKEARSIGNSLWEYITPPT